MWNLVKYEWRRIWDSKLTRISVLGCALFILFCVYSSISQISAVDSNGESHTGAAAIAVLKETRTRQVLDQSRVEEIMKEYLEYTRNPQTNSDIEKNLFLSEQMYRTYYLPNRELLALISSNYMPFGEDLTTRQCFEENLGKDFYEARTKRTSDWLEMQVYQGYMRAAEKEYWFGQDAGIDEYEYGYYKAWGCMLDSVSWNVMLLIIICIGTAPVFAGEYQTKTDSLLLSMRFGKSKLIRAKILASVCYTSVIYWGIVIGYALIYFAVLGCQGATLPIQLYNPSYPISYNFTMMQAVLVLFAVGYICSLFIMAITLCMSSVLKSPYSVIIIDFLLIVIPAFLYGNMGGYLWQHILALMPSKIAELKFDDYLAYSFGEMVVNRPGMLGIVYSIGSIILIFTAYQKFRQHEVNC